MKGGGGPVDRRKRLAANARERKRMNLLNEAYDQLRRRLNDAENKSKYDVLVQAKEYIQALARICADFDRANPDHPTLTGAILPRAGTARATAKVSATGGQPEPEEARAGRANNKRQPARTRLNRPQPRARPQHLTIAAPIGPAPLATFESPSSPSDCLSPVSLPDSIGSSAGSCCSSQHNPFYDHQGHQQHQFPLLHARQPAHSPYHQQLNSKILQQNEAAYLMEARVRRIKQEPMDEYRQIYHQHYQSFFQAHKQATL